MVVSTDPANDATGVPVGKTITVTFIEDVQAGSAYDSISLKDASGNTLDVSKSVSGNMLTIVPNTSLAYSTGYTVTMPAGAVKDLAGNALAQDYIFSFTAEAAPPTTSSLELKVADVTGAPGSTVQVPVILTSQGQVAAVEFVLAYSSKLLTFQGVEKGQLTLDWSIQGNVIELGKVKILAYLLSLETVTSGSGSVAVLTFQVAANATSGATCDLTLQDVVLSDATGGALAGVNRVSGSFTVQ